MRPVELTLWPRQMIHLVWEMIYPYIGKRTVFLVKAQSVKREPPINTVHASIALQLGAHMEDSGISAS